MIEVITITAYEIARVSNNHGTRRSVKGIREKLLEILRDMRDSLWVCPLLPPPPIFKFPRTSLTHCRFLCMSWSGILKPWCYPKSHTQRQNTPLPGLSVVEKLGWRWLRRHPLQKESYRKHPWLEVGRHEFELWLALMKYLWKPMQPWIETRGVISSVLV